MGQYVYITTNPPTRDSFEKLRKKWNRKGIVLIDQMVNYFLKTGYDPADQEAAMPGPELKKLSDQIKQHDNKMVSFFRTQEKNLVKPMGEKVDGLMMVVAEYLKEQKEISYEIVDEGPGADTEESSGEELTPVVPGTAESAGVSKQEFVELQIRCEKAEKKLKLYQENLRKIEDSCQWKSTGLSKGFVLDISRDEVEHIFGLMQDVR